MFDLETYSVVRDLVRDSKGGERYLEIRPYLQRYALNTTLTLCYGIRMDDVWDDMLREVLEVGSAISLLRSASENYQDYIPSQSSAGSVIALEYTDVLRKFSATFQTTRRQNEVNRLGDGETNT
jgi:hypothetical protein